VNCPPSARLEEKEADNSSSFAAEGTLAHELAEVDIRTRTFIGSRTEQNKLKKERSQLQKSEYYSSDMDGYVETYVDYVLEAYHLAKKKTKDAVLKVEERTDFSYLVPEGFGTSDANIIADDQLEIIDLKYGKGVKVDAIGNDQLRLYALGLLRKFQLIYDIQEVKMTIVQPRLNHIDSEVLTVGELIDYSEAVILPAAQKAWNGQGDQTPGEWCKFCKVKAKCRALHDHNLALAASDFADPYTLSDTEIVEAYAQSSLLTDWVNALSNYMLKEALDGKKWPGYKLVEGRSVRKWADEQKALKVLTKEFSLEEVTNTKIKGIGEIEKLLGREELATLNLTIKPQGKPTLAPEGDKRPEFNNAKTDFQK
jgi:hypothetical protein